MVVSQNKGTPIQTPKYYNPYYGDPQKGTLNFGKALKLLEATGLSARPGEEDPRGGGASRGPQRSMWGFPKFRGTFLGVPILRTIVY